jgi:hypothetical protein
LNGVKDKGKWKWKLKSAIIDSGTIDHVADPEVFTGIKVHPTEQSENGGSWRAAGGAPIKKLGQMFLPWKTEGGTDQRICLKAGKVGQTLLSTDKLESEGWETMLTVQDPHLLNLNTGEKIKVHKTPGKLPYVNMWAKLWEPDVVDVGRGETNAIRHSVFRRPTP